MRAIRRNLPSARHSAAVDHWLADYRAQSEADELLARLPELALLDAIPRELAKQAAQRDLLTSRLAREAEVRDLPPPGTTVAGALRLEVRRLRERLSAPGTATGIARGIESGREAVLRALEGRAGTLDADKPGLVRPAPASVEIKDSKVLGGLRWHVLDGPDWSPESRIREATHDKPLARARADLTPLLMPELSRLADAAAELKASERETWQLRVRAAEAGVSDEETAWRTAFATELRRQADEVAVRPIIADEFGPGYQLAATHLSA